MRGDSSLRRPFIRCYHLGLARYGSRVLECRPIEPTLAVFGTILRAPFLCLESVWCSSDHLWGSARGTVQRETTHVIGRQDERGHIQQQDQANSNHVQVLPQYSGL